MTPTPKAIENAARALARRRGFDFPSDWEYLYHPKSDIGLAVADATAALSADLGGMVLVPKKATPEMLAHGMNVWSRHDDAEEDVDGIYRAMIAAAEGER